MHHAVYAEEMIGKWLEHTNLWARHESEGSYIVPRDYILEHRYAVHPMDPGDVVDDLDDFLIVLHAAVTDELGHVEMIGVFSAELDEEGGPTGAAVLDYLTACIDTEWRDVWAAGKFLNVP